MTSRHRDPADPTVVPGTPDAAGSDLETTPVHTPGSVAEVQASESASTRAQDLPDSSGGLLGSAWVGLVLGALVTILLLIFIAQNTTSTEVHFLGAKFALPLGVLILFAAIAGALIMALFAGFRILQLRMRARKTRKLTSSRRR